MCVFSKWYRTSPLIGLLMNDLVVKPAAEALSLISS